MFDSFPPQVNHLLTSTPIRYCARCGWALHTIKVNNQKYCQDTTICRSNIKREQDRIHNQRYRQRWRKLWGRNRAKESLGSGWLTSPHPRPTTEEELRDVEAEVRRLRLKR